jgi:hypothetical protein
MACRQENPKARTRSKMPAMPPAHGGQKEAPSPKNLLSIPGILEIAKKPSQPHSRARLSCHDAPNIPPGRTPRVTAGIKRVKLSPITWRLGLSSHCLRLTISTGPRRRRKTLQAEWLPWSPVWVRRLWRRPPPAPSGRCRCIARRCRGRRRPCPPATALYRRSQLHPASPATIWRPPP